ncbi:MAG: aldo/keto reductase [Flavitalea sp.]
MTSRRKFLSTTFTGMAVAATAPLIPAIGSDIVKREDMFQGAAERFKLKERIGMGGVAVANGFALKTEPEAYATLEGAWKAGVRYFDTSPWYGLGLGERRFGSFLQHQKRDEYILSTKVGRLLQPSAVRPEVMWKNPPAFKHKYDYTADGVKRSIEDSLQRLGVERIDIVFIHDLSPDNGDLKDKWTEQFEIARKGAMPALTRLREEGVIKAWGLGVNRIEPILKTLEVADADIFLSATQYSLIKHEDAVNRLLPACKAKNVSLVIGAALNAGFLAGVDRYDYSGTFPDGVKEKRAKIEAIAKSHNVDLRTAALQFSSAPSVVAAVIPGASNPNQMAENIASMKAHIPPAFWQELKKEKLIAESAQV